MRVLGCDPGQTGALSLIDTDGWTLSVFDMPQEAGTGKRTAVSPTGVAIAIQRARPDHAYIEEVASSPQMGVASAFAFGRSYGILLGACAADAMLTTVRPQVWKAKLACPKDKSQARRRAQQLFPNHYKLFERVKDDGRAESALIALYGLLSLGIVPETKLVLEDWP